MQIGVTGLYIGALWLFFDWYSKYPPGIYRKRYGTTLDHAIGKVNANQVMKRFFGPSSLLVSVQKLIESGEMYLNEELAINKIISKIDFAR